MSLVHLHPREGRNVATRASRAVAPAKAAALRFSPMAAAIALAPTAAAITLALLAAACSAPVKPSPGTTATAPAGPAAATDGPGSPSAIERSVLADLNAYRDGLGLAPLRLSKSLAKVARVHARDLAKHGFGGACNIHSWSGDGPWNSCCYDEAHSQARCMWNKPREITSYDGVGYEIGYWFSAGVRAGNVVPTWRRSPAHDAVIANRGAWARRTWRAVGVGVEGDYAVAWFGEEEDPAGYWD